MKLRGPSLLASLCLLPGISFGASITYLTPGASQPTGLGVPNGPPLGTTPSGEAFYAEASGLRELFIAPGISVVPIISRTHSSLNSARTTLEKVRSFYVSGTGADRAVRPYLLRPGSDAVKLATPGNAPAVPTGVALDAEVATGTSTSDLIRAFFWERGSLRTVAPPSGTLGARFLGINPQGTRFVGSVRAESATEAAIYERGEWTRVKPLVGLSAMAFNLAAPDGSVAGFAYRPGPNGIPLNPVAVRYLRGELKSLGRVSVERSFTIPRGVSADGEVIVGQYFGGSPSDGRAFIWQAGIGIRDLREVAREQGLASELEGVQLVDAVGISDNRKWIYVAARKADGSVRPALLELKLGRQPQLESVEIEPKETPSGSAVEVTVRLDREPEKPFELPVRVTPGSQNLEVLRIVAGQRTQRFEWRTGGPAETFAGLTATHRGVARSAYVRLTRPVPAQVTFSANPIAGGVPLTGEVRLRGTAPTGGLVVKLESNNDLATVPATVRIAAGLSHTTFRIQTRQPLEDTEAEISARANEIVAKGSLRIMHNRIKTLFLTSGLKQDGTPMDTWDQVTAGFGGYVYVKLMEPARVTETVKLGGENFELLGASPTITIDKGQTYGITPFTAKEVFVEPKLIDLRATRFGEVHRKVITNFPIKINYITVSNTISDAGWVDYAIVYLNARATRDTKVTISSDSPLITGPKTVTIPKGEFSHRFNLSVLPVNENTYISLFATFGGATVGANVLLEPPIPFKLKGPENIVGGRSFELTITLTGPAPVDGFKAMLDVEGATEALEPLPDFVFNKGERARKFTVRTRTVSEAKLVTFLTILQSLKLRITP